MAHYAKIDGGIVSEVIVISDANVSTLPGTWLKTSFNTLGGLHYGADGNPDAGEALRGNYAGVGYSYDSERDAFIPPQPYPSWVLNEATYLWAPPLQRPDDGKMYEWEESTTSWVER